MNNEQRSILHRSFSRFPHPRGVKLSYGTAGFRADASFLEAAAFRMGVLSSLRSLKTQSIVGMMITASHNEVSDNGIKIADPSGGMLSLEWEPLADALVNSSDSHHFVELISEYFEKEDTRFEYVKAPEVFLARDTRPSGDRLLQAAKHGVGAIIGAISHDLGILTTPQLHWMVRSKNKGMSCTEMDYFKLLSVCFRCLVDLIPNQDGIKDLNDKLVVDGANGVGGEKLCVLTEMLPEIHIEVRNSGKNGGILNHKVGADYVQKEKVAPAGFGSNDVGIRCASLDGDADRLVYFSVTPNGGSEIELVDGDKILSLFAVFIMEQIHVLNEDCTYKIKNPYRPHVGVVQTAYANGASTHFLKQLGLEVVLTPTGVKYLHDRASDYDIGIYFEANGHGTITFSDSFLLWLEARKNELSSVPEDRGLEVRKAVERLVATSKLINQAVGDALSGLLLVEIILKHNGWSLYKWSELYQDLPSRQLKIKVEDRSAIETTNSETVVLRPLGIQEAINIAVSKYDRGRSFIRPSGTENVVRVYAEAGTQDAADQLALSVLEIVHHYFAPLSS